MVDPRAGKGSGAVSQVPPDLGAGAGGLGSWVVEGTPIAVLLVDVGGRRVVHADGVAQQLAPGVALPAPIDGWSDAAELRDLDGDRLSESEHPLSRVGLSKEASGQAVSAARATELGRRREPLWVVGLPLSGAQGLEGHALVVFMPLRERDTVESELTQASLRERAVLATGLSFTVADAQADDQPLVWVNPAFTATTGYEFGEAVGRNCRFLQGAGTDPLATDQMRRAIRAGESVSVTLLNHRKDGTAFWNQVALSPISDSQGALTHYVGIQTDVTGQVVADEERDRALAAERVARQDAQQAHQQLALLAEASAVLSATLDVREALSRLTVLVVPRMADWVLLVLPDRQGGIGEVLARHRDGREHELAVYTEFVRHGLRPEGLVPALLRGAPPRRVGDLGHPERRAERGAWVLDPSVNDLTDRLGAGSALFVPLPGRRQVVGAMVLLRGPDGPAYTDHDLSVATDLGRRAGLMLDNARLYQAEHHIAETLQRSLLPDLPALAGVTAAARYRAGETGADVGGDFYELLALPDGDIGLAIGDVVGHDMLAAASMGHLRGLLQACAYDVGPGDGEADRRDPAHVLERVDELVAGLRLGTIATVGYSRLRLEPGGGWQLDHSSAGHLPLLLRGPDGRVELVEGTPDLPLGVEVRPRASLRRQVEAGTTVVAYTDGLLERRGESLDEGLRRLCDTVAGGPDAPDALCEHLLAVLGDGGDDDIAVLAVRLGGLTPGG